MKEIKHNLPVYYNPDVDAIHVVHGKQDGKIIIGAPCRFYGDAYTCITRYLVEKSIMKNWIRLNKKKLDSYPFLSREASFQGSLSIVDLSDGNFAANRKRVFFAEKEGVSYYQGE